MDSGGRWSWLDSLGFGLSNIIFIEDGRENFWFHAASITRRMVDAISGPYLPSGDNVKRISTAVIALTLED